MYKFNKSREKPLIEMLEQRTLLSGAVVDHTTAALSVARYNVTATTAGDKALFVGGGLSAVTSSRAVDIYDDGTGTWSATALPDGVEPQLVGAAQKAYFETSTQNEVEAFDGANNSWSSLTVPAGTTKILDVAGSPVFEVSSAAGTGFHFADGVAQIGNDLSEGNSDSVSGTKIVTSPFRITLFDTLSGITRTYANPPLYYGAGGPTMAVIGTKLLFVDTNGGLGAKTTAFLFDTVTGRGAPIEVPDDLRISSAAGSFTVVGEKVIFGTAANYNDQNVLLSNTAAVYDVGTNQWSTSSVGGGPDATAVGDKALFAGGQPSNFRPSNQVDIYTDLSPTSVLAGGVIGKARGRAQVVLTNSGDADLEGPYTVQVCAVPPRQYHDSVNLGTIQVNSGLSEGSSVRVAVPISLPASCPAGTYTLVAFIRSSDGILRPLAGGMSTFVVHTHKSISENAMISSPAQSIVAPALSAAADDNGLALSEWLHDTTKNL